MIPILLVGILALLFLVTQVGIFVIERRYPAQGQAIEIDGATINLVDIGAKNPAGPPLLLIHGASSNLEAMRGPLGNLWPHRAIASCWSIVPAMAGAGGRTSAPPPRQPRRAC